MSSRSKRDKELSDLGDDLAPGASNEDDKKSKRKRSKHVLPKSQSTRPTLDDYHRPTILGKGLDQFVQTKIFQDYLQCEDKPWVYPKRSTDKIELEPISSEFLPPLNTGPLFMTISGKNKKSERVRRVCGYREIFQKRIHVEYLKDEEKDATEFLSEEDENANYLVSESPQSATSHEDVLVEQIHAETEGSGPRQHTIIKMPDYHETPSEIAAHFRTQPIVVYKAMVHHANHAAGHPRGKSNHPTNHGHNPGHGKGHDKGHGKAHFPNKGHGHDKGHGQAKGHGPNKGHGHVLHDKGHDKGQGPIKGHEPLKGHGQGDKPHSIMRTPKHPPDKYGLPHFDITDFESYYKYVYGVPIKNLPERDSEWLELSETDEEGLDEEIQSFEKPAPKWMIPDISFESQQLVIELRLMYYVCLLTGRMFYFTKPNILQGHLEFLTKRLRMIPFFMSSFILWASLVIVSQSYASIVFGEADTNSTRGRTRQQAQIEQLEINKYGVSILYVMVNLAFVAVWSVFVILRDGQLITHYFNCWCPALAEMETSSAIGIRKMTFYNLLVWLVPSGMLVVGFFFKFPANIRGTAGLVAILMFRNVFPDIRLKNKDDLFYFQLFGLVFIIYVLFCARMLFNLMQIIALIIKNSAEMWNFKFALAFNQLMLTNRGQMKRISLQLPLVKFFTHRRLMTALVNIYGDIFGVPIMIYMVVQVGLLTYVLVHLFNYKAGDIKEYNGKSKVEYEFYPSKAVGRKKIEIEFYHKPVEEISTNLFILAMVCFDYIFTTEVIASASQSFCDAFEFVRRTNLILCKTSHQRRLVQSLLWSMSATQPTLLSAGNYFPIYRPTIVAGLGVAIAFFSLIIQLQSEPKHFYIEFPSCDEQIDEENEIGEPRCRGKIVPNSTLS